jgi:general secretion pathway protein D
MKRLAMILALSALPAALVFAQDEFPGKKGAEEEIAVNLQRVKMEELIKIVQKETGKVFLYDDKVVRLGEVSFQGAQPIPRKALFSVFKSILETQGFGLTEILMDGLEVYKIMEARRTYAGPGQTFSGDSVKAKPDILPQDDTMVTVVYALQYADARVVMNNLRNIVNQNQGGNILGIPNVNVLVVTAFGSVMTRIFRIIELMDVPGPQPVWKVLKIVHADPETVATKVESILQSMQQQAQKRQLQAQPMAKLVPEPRTRSLIIQALPEQFPEILSLIQKLDVQLEREPSPVVIIPLRNTNAEDMETTVNAILQANPDLGAAGAEPGADEKPAVPGEPPRRPLPRGSRTQGTGATAGEEEQTAAIADKATNSLIVIAPEAISREIRRIVEALDRRRPQVLIEAVIVEISSARGVSLGAELAVIDRAAEGKTRGFGATLFGLSNIVDTEGNPIDATGGSSFTPGGRLPSFSSQGMTLGITAGKDFKIPLLLTLLGSESDVNVLSLPRVLTNENEEAVIKVMESVPTAQSQSTSAVSASVGFSGFEDAGITLTIKPTISGDGSLRLKIEQTIEQFTGTSTVLESAGVVLPPSKTTREIKNEVTVPNHRTVILGGLSSTTVRETTSKIPLLGDIPIIGNLFSREQRDLKKTNLFVFITPHVLDDPEFRDLERISDRHLNEASAMGIPTHEIDREYRQAFREEAGLGAVAPGTAVDRMDYVSPRDKR